MKQIKSLDDLMGGAALERFQKGLQEVLRNIQDPNTDPKKTRAVKLTLTIKPDKDRASAKFLLSCQPVLAPAEPYESNVLLSRDDHGHVAAAEFGNQIPGQMSIDDETGEIKEKTSPVVVFRSAQ